MKHIAKTLPALAVAAGMALVMVTSGFTKTNTDPFWELKSGITQVSTDPSDYVQSTNNCQGSAEFCGFTAPAIGSEPDIPNGSDLESDLQSLHDDPSSGANTSQVISFKN
ncbi:hypothetical protein [Arachidicoccus terrestris]|uniref:hypothetical protein n=1 Tax=Arachidicoccus terrestris TaxID=2875539 RepID=UPI001CC6D834|nr:hypothetical protein [Arachidicoccus terrestris]UAY56024.1 hypothetical protein K9M52_03055 [Arachidicoccus terrestris]